MDRVGWSGRLTKEATAFRRLFFLRTTLADINVTANAVKTATLQATSRVPIEQKDAWLVYVDVDIALEKKASS